MSTFDVQQENRIETILDDLAHQAQTIDTATSDRDRLIRAARAEGAKIDVIAREARLSRSQVNNILGNRKG